ncbi:ABC transporter ATP-binding protein [Vibrio tapetis]|uniref:Outer membrane-specific lipoprotein transporter subunit ATP-binding component of ABC superfamily n=1 Tax=Vibrio tapetis subsp. tapetis TaxID=1671868 RepID=A0A2N8ZLV8_9VIBR|nr:ABC transporter ATP-binding protein [Vibrio tapetis]SON52888.1 outer membrane-specific lipoprotein transporter subunit; ATP-binding component of ABC superfamily [Vibrio tapetis subsp. tapetis]
MLRFSQIEKQYQLGQLSVHALKSVDGCIQKGEMVALCGPSGSGKSTLLNVLGLLDMQYQGEVLLNGEPLPKDKYQAAKIRRQQLGFIFQRFNLMPVMTALENVSYPLHLNGVSLKEQKKRSSDMLERVGLKDFLHHRPDNLSGGQQQRVAIARALVNTPSLVIADEPTASLDSQTASQVIEIMKSLGREFNTTFVVATHDPRMAKHCDRAIQLLDGEINKESLKWVS